MKGRRPVAVLGEPEHELRKHLRLRAAMRETAALDRVTVYVNVPGADDNTDALPIERARLGGLLSLVWATLWCRPNARTHVGSPVHWDASILHPWVVEIHGMWPNIEDPESTRVGVVFRVPCRVDPRTPSPEADAAIAHVVARALLHEGQEALEIDGRRPLDPHRIGEVGLAAVFEAADAALASADLEQRINAFFERGR